MKQKINEIILSIITLAILVGVGFYIVPKFILKQQTGWTNAIDSIINFIKTNWIWILVVLAVLIIAVITIIILVKKHKEN